MENLNIMRLCHYLKKNKKTRKQKQVEFVDGK